MRGTETYIGVLLCDLLSARNFLPALMKESIAADCDASGL